MRLERLLDLPPCLTGPRTFGAADDVEPEGEAGRQPARDVAGSRGEGDAEDVVGVVDRGGGQGEAPRVEEGVSEGAVVKGGANEGEDHFVEAVSLDAGGDMKDTSAERAVFVELGLDGDEEVDGLGLLLLILVAAVEGDSVEDAIGAVGAEAVGVVGEVSEAVPALHLSVVIRLPLSERAVVHLGFAVLVCAG